MLTTPSTMWTSLSPNTARPTSAGRPGARRAKLIIENCAHPDYRPQLREYFAEACATSGGQTPHVRSKALSWHQRYVETGSMK